MSYWEPPTADPMELLVMEAEAWLDMSDADIAIFARKTGRTEAEARALVAEKISRYRLVNPHDLSPDQYRRLFRQEPGQ